MKGKRRKLLLLYTLILTGGAFGFRCFFLIGFVPSASMEPALAAGSVVLGTYPDRTEISRYDILVFQAPDAPSTHYVKRVIGLPGETIRLADGKVYVDGERLEEPYLAEGMETEGEVVYRVPPDSYFMLGDNRGDSQDSRSWDHPYVPSGYLVAQVRCILYPFSRCGKIRSFSAGIAPCRNQKSHI